MYGKLACTAVLLLCLARGLPVAAQQAVPVPVGATVRIASPAYSGVAVVVSPRADSLQMVIEGLAAPVSVPTASIARLERRRSATAVERAVRGAMWGGAVMGVLGLVMVAVDGASGIADAPADQPSEGGFVVLGAASGALWGGVIGLAIPQHRWEPVALPVRLGLSPAGGGGVALGGSLAF